MAPAAIGGASKLAGIYRMQPLQVPAPYVVDVTTTSLLPPLRAGAVPVISVLPTTVLLRISAPPIVTLVTSLKFAPVIVTLRPPTMGPAMGLTATTARPTYVKHPVQWPADVPDNTTTSRAPGAVVGGAVPVIIVALTTVRLVISLPPIVTLLTPVKFLPVIVRLVPPARGPLAGLTASTIGGGAELVDSEQLATRKGISSTTLLEKTLMRPPLPVLSTSPEVRMRSSHILEETRRKKPSI